MLYTIIYDFLSTICPSTTAIQQSWLTLATLGTMSWLYICMLGLVVWVVKIFGGLFRW